MKQIGTRVMMLEKWMRINRWSDPKFATGINVLLSAKRFPEIQYRSVANWRKGICLPRLQVIEAIETFTDGQVLYADHAAAVHSRRKAA